MPENRRRKTEGGHGKRKKSASGTRAWSKGVMEEGAALTTSEGIHLIAPTVRGLTYFWERYGAG